VYLRRIMVVKKGSVQRQSSVLDAIEQIDETKPSKNNPSGKIKARVVSVAQNVSINYQEFMSRTTNVANDKTDHVWPFLVKVSTNGSDEEGQKIAAFKHLQSSIVEYLIP
jgi:hypothetical protein